MYLIIGFVLFLAVILAFWAALIEYQDGLNIVNEIKEQKWHPGHGRKLEAIEMIYDEKTGIAHGYLEQK